MSAHYSIEIKIDLIYSIESLQKLLKKGRDLRFKYYEFVLGQIEVSGSELNIDQALQVILVDKTESNFHVIIAQYQDTYITINFYDSGKNILLSFSDFTYPWLKKFDDGDKDIDVCKYAKVMLDLVEDYKILEMKIEKN